MVTATVSRALGPALAGAALRPGERVKVGLFGDSVTEGIVIPHFQTVGLAAQLTRAETHDGFSAGGEGLIAANQYEWRFNTYGILGLSPTPATGWALVGAQDGSVVQPGTDGASGYSAMTDSAAATATTTVPDPDVQVLYTTSPEPCRFTVTSGTRRWTIDSSAPNAIEPVPAEYPITLGPGSHRLVVHGSSCGVVLDGVVSQAPVTPGTIQIQVDNDGHAARLPSTDLARRIVQAIVQQRYQVSVFLYGYIGELLVSPGATAATYDTALVERARLARRDGGRCLIVEPTPMLGVSRSRVSLVSRLERSVARRVGCTYTAALAHLWSPAAAVHAGLLVIDGIHPTASGYARIARALAPVIAKLARA